jgi:hypothetical protein
MPTDDRCGSNSEVAASQPDVCFTPESGHWTDIPGGPFSADIVAKVFSGWRTKILRPADASGARRREGPYRFIQNRSRTSVAALKSDAAAEKPKDQLWRDFQGCSIFDFCNNICH